ncbi:MAG TPA: AEC family transporter, partial [Alphaproteobacteria bacterium]|nr:AEC family transporter [Alphaproteobacteria bacterium]
PLGLLAAGAGLDMRALLGGAGGMVALACGLRLLAMPALMLATTALFGVEGMTRTCVLIYAVVPAPPGAYILARQLGGNDRLMAAIIAASTLAAILTVPAWLALLA